jgi:AcrR family transcriptional regulator
MVAKVDGNTLRTQRTRARVLSESLRLFNERGEANVTTGAIATELGMSPGNLYYHFRNKDEIVGELYAALESKVAPLFALPEGRAADVEDLWLLLHLLFEAAWAYRFFYRDLIELTSRNRRLGVRFAELARRGESTVIQLCRGMTAAGTMQATDAEIAALARNVAIVATYWMSYERTLQPAGAGTGEFSMNLDRAAYQVLTLIAPYAIGDARALIERLGERYL